MWNRLKMVFRSLFGWMIRGMENPELVLRQLMDDMRQKMAAGNLTPAEKKEMEGMRSRIMEQILAGRDEDLLDVREAEIPAPDKARIYPSLVCQECGERFMEIMGRTAEGKVLCKDCFEKKVC